MQTTSRLDNHFTSADYAKITDSHFHSLAVKKYGLDIETALKTLYRGIDIGTEADDLPSRHEFLQSYDNIYLSAAMGPWETANRNIDQIDQQLTVLESNIEKYNPKFIGEAGLDNHDSSYGSAEIQEYLFEKHMILAENLNKRILIHNREADSQVAGIIKKYSVTGVIHCFSGDETLMKTALDYGYWISFAGNLTFKANTNLRDMLKKVPRNRILLETDAPYLTPVPLRGNPNSPVYIINTYICAAETLGISFEELKETVASNFEDFCR